VLPWIAPVCLVLIFFLQFFNWVGVYPGGVPAAWQGAWGAAFGSLTTDPDLAGKEPGLAKGADNAGPGASVFTIFYILLFILLALPLTVASVVLERIPMKLPPGVEQAMPWRWGIVAALNLFVFLFLALQLMVGFSMEKKIDDAADKVGTPDGKKTDEAKAILVAKGVIRESVKYTFWLKLVVLLHLVAVVSALLMFWVDRRGPSRPLPRIDLLT
jgi:hypothetical protein